MSDFQYLQSILDELIIEEFTEGDKHELGPQEIHKYLSRVMYGRRSKMNPLWNSLLVGGKKDGKRYAPTCCARGDIPLIVFYQVPCIRRSSRHKWPYCLILDTRSKRRT